MENQACVCATVIKKGLRPLIARRDSKSIHRVTYMSRYCSTYVSRNEHATHAQNHGEERGVDYGAGQRLDIPVSGDRPFTQSSHRCGEITESTNEHGYICMILIPDDGDTDNARETSRV